MPKGPPIRPTPDRVKEAIFSSLGERILGARVLDLFAGTGALGIEAASRGAALALLVDESRFALAAAEANAEKSHLANCVRICRADAFSLIGQLASRGEEFSVVFADPPYEKRKDRQSSLAKKVLKTPALVSILAPDGVLVMEHFKDDQLDTTTDWELRRQLCHGDTRVSFFQRSSTTVTEKRGE